MISVKLTKLARIAMMKYFTSLTVVYAAIVAVLLTFSTVSSAKKRCKPLLEKLHNIQATQRKSYSLKRGQTLRAKEDKARDKWWQCENSSLASFKSKYGTKKKKSKKKSKKKVLASKSTYYTKMNKEILNSSKQRITFNQDSVIVIKAKYQGDKRLAWLQFYQQPMKCQSPKNLNVFAYCTEDKLQQQGLFEQKYSR